MRIKCCPWARKDNAVPRAELIIRMSLLFYCQEPYATFPYSMMTIFVMTLGELNYADIFMPWDKLEYSALTNILFFLFVLGMPIILMNMLVSINSSLQIKVQTKMAII